MSAYPKTTTVTDLKIYPIKSCRGISVKSSILTKKGLQYDRRCMFVDSKREFITIRGKSEMTWIKTRISQDDVATLHVTFPKVTKVGDKPEPDYDSATTISFPLDPNEDWLANNAQLIEAEIWGEKTDAYALVVPEIANVVSTYFESLDGDSKVELVIKGPKNRICRGNGDKEFLGREEYVDFPDVLPIQVANETSLEELNGRLSQAGAGPITIERFRPNIIVNSQNLEAWEEDEWKMLRINPPKSYLGMLGTMTGVNNTSIDVDVVARCARCHVPNVDPDTAVPDKKYPWDALYKYRRVDEGIKFKPCFGMLCCPRNEGVIEVGMEIEIREVMAAAGGSGEHYYQKGM